MDNRQVFTRREIEKDLKHKNKIGFGIMIGILPLIFIFWLLAAWAFELEDRLSLISIFCFILAIILTVFDLYGIGYYAVKNFTPLEYEIVTDAFEYESEYHSRHYTYLTFQFKCYGEYMVGDSNKPTTLYYRWSKDCQMWDNQFRGCTPRGEEFYLIIVDGRICYIYSTRIFKFVETENK